MASADPLSALPGALLPWFEKAARDLPWRRDREPYHVWLSEIMLQQTRVEAVRGYYARFLAEIPDIPSLAAADPERLRKLWEGLGYYSRVRNLQTAARQIMEEHGGVFPSSYPEIRRLKGVGDYTAGAIASICFELPEPAVDGNVARISARITGDARPANTAAFRSELRERLRSCYPAGRCGAFTQALMELGAVVCIPAGAPRCGDCPAAGFCLAREGLWRSLPAMEPKKPRRREELTVFLLRCGERIALRQRESRGLLAGLWELPNVPGGLSPAQAVAQAERWGAHPRELLRESRGRHIFTHVEWEMRCFTLECVQACPEFTWADAAALRSVYALPTAFRKFTEDAFPDARGH